MKNIFRRKLSLVFIFTAFAFYAVFEIADPKMHISGQTNSSSPTPAPAAVIEFNQTDALARLREQIKGRENEPAETVFKNIRMMKTVPAGRFLAIMEMGYARSLGVNCAHCQVPEKWESEQKPTKQVAREMSAMVGTINNSLLKNIKNLKSDAATVNCTTCHRGQIKPALNLPVATQRDNL